MEPVVHDKAEGAKKVIVAASSNSHRGPRTRSTKTSGTGSSVGSPRHGPRNRAKTYAGTSNINLNGSLMKPSWPGSNGVVNLSLPASPEKRPLGLYPTGNVTFGSPSSGIQLSNAGQGDSNVARFNATLFSSAAHHMNQGLDVEEAMDIDHQDTDEEAAKNAAEPSLSETGASETIPSTLPLSSEDDSTQCDKKYPDKVIGAKEQGSGITGIPEMKESREDSSSKKQKKEASKDDLKVKLLIMKTKAIPQNKKRAIYIVLHVSTVMIGELTGKATAPVKIYGDKIFIEMETDGGHGASSTCNFRIPCKDLVDCKISLNGQPFLIVVKTTPFGATAIRNKFKEKGHFLDPESEDIKKRHIVLLMNYKEIPRDVKKDLVELFQNRLAEQLTWSELSPNEAQQYINEKKEAPRHLEETNTRSPKPTSPAGTEQRKILTPKGKGARKNLFSEGSKSAAATVSASLPISKAQNAPGSQERGSQHTEELSDCTVQTRSRRRKGSAPMDPDNPVLTGSQPVKPDILLHHKEMESHITLLDQHSKEQRENLQQHQKLLEVERGKLRAVEDEKDRHIGRMRDLQISFSADKEILLQRIRALETTIAEKDEAFNQQTLTLAMLNEEVEKKQASLRQLRQDLERESETNCHLRNLQIELTRVRQALDEEATLRRTREQQLRDKETAVHELQRTLGEEQQARLRSESELRQARGTCSQLEESLEAVRLSSQSLQQNLQTKEETLTEQSRQSEREREERTALEERFRRLQREMEDERNLRASTERELAQERRSLLQDRANLERERDTYEQRIRDSERTATESQRRMQELQSAVSVAQEAVAEYQRLEPRDWIIRRDEVQLSEKSLGVGAWGTVCEGTFRGCQVAVKQIHHLILSPHNRRLFEREMSIASRCRHPNLLQFIGATNDDGSPLFITELLDTDLRSILSRRALHHEEIVCLALDVARGLNYLHLNKPFPIMHRDISSSNVLVWRRDDSWRAKLSDYGAANFMRQCMTVNPGARIYAAPESLTSQQSPKADVFSFGLLLCEMCVRELPVPQQIQQQIGLVSNGVLRELVMRCVETSPEARPAMSHVIGVLLQQAETLRAQGLVSINGRSATL